MSEEIEEDTVKFELDQEKEQNDEINSFSPESPNSESRPKNETLEGKLTTGTLENKPENETLEIKPEKETLEIKPVKEALENKRNKKALEIKPEKEAREIKPEKETLENKPKNETLENKPGKGTVKSKPKNVGLKSKPKNEAQNSEANFSGPNSSGKFLATVATQTEISVSNFVQVSAPLVDGASKEIFELPLDKSGELSLDTLRTEFPNASGIKYKNPETGMMRILKQERGCIAPPPEGWGKTQFIVCIAKDSVNLKRSAPSDSNDRPQGRMKMAKTSRGLLQAPALNASMGVMGSMSGPPISMPGGPMMNQGPPIMGPPQQGPVRSLMNPILGLTSMNGPPQLGGPGPGMGNVYTNMNTNMGMYQPGPQLQGQQFNNGYEMSYTDVTMDDLGMQNFDNNNFGPGPIGGPGGPGPGHPTTCDLCQVQLNSLTQAQLHFEGKRHADAVSQMQAQMNAGPSGYPMMPMHGGGGPSQGQSMRSGGGRTGLLGRGGTRPYQSNKGGGGNFRNNNNNNRNFDNRNRRNGPAGNFGGGGRGSGNRRGGFKSGRGGGRGRSRDQNGPDNQPQSFDNDDWSSSGFNDFSGPSA